MGEEKLNVRYGKAMTASEASTIRELVDLSNALHIPREDVVSIISSEGGYIMIYYY